MLRLSPAVEGSMRDGVEAARTAIARLAVACEALRAEAPPDMQERFALSIRRLRAVEADLVARSRHPGGDALFVALSVTQAALAGVAESFSEMQHTLKRLLPFDEPAPGWFVDEGEGVGV
jgi:hypothetical protein